MLPVIRADTALSAALFPPPHQPRTLVCCSNHRLGSGSITAGSFVSNWAPSRLLFLNSIGGVRQILFQRGTQNFPVLQPPGSTEASLRASELKLGAGKPGNTPSSAKRYLSDSPYTTAVYIKNLVFTKVIVFSLLEYQSVLILVVIAHHPVSLALCLFFEKKYFQCLERIYHAG